MPDISIRNARADDLAFILDLMLLDDVTGLPAQWQRPDPSVVATALERIDADPNQHLFIAEVDWETVGTFQLTFIPGVMLHGMWRGLIEGVHVAPAHRNNGYGGQMIRWAIDRCREHGCTVVQLTSNKKRVDAHRFYRALGFANSHEGFRLAL